MQFLLSKSLRRLSRLYGQALINAIPELHLENDADILLLLASSTARPTQKEISEILQIDKSRVAILIEGLKHKGLIYTERNHADRREHFVFLTDKGITILPKIQQAIDQVNVTMSRELKDETLACFYKTLLQIQNNLADQAQLSNEQGD
jgi:DNA-binding MarR family transcriptional regulator